MAIQDYDFKIKYIEGPRNYIANTLSRMPGKVTESEKNAHATIAIILACRPDSKLENEMIKIQIKKREDVRVNQIIELIETGEVRREYHLRDGVLIKGKPGHERIVLTRTIMHDLIREVHELYRHIGGLKCYKIISDDFFYPKLKKSVAWYVRACTSCQLNKTYTQNNQAPTKSIVPDGPGELVSIDFGGPLPTPRAGSKYLLVAMDAFTNYVQLYTIKRADTRTTIRKNFDDYILKRGKPKAIQTDHGT